MRTTRDGSVDARSEWFTEIQIIPREHRHSEERNRGEEDSPSALPSVQFAREEPNPATIPYM